MQGIQEKIASGKNINRASDDPVGAVNLSVAKEQKEIISQFLRNTDVAHTRLDLSDKTLDELTTVLTRMTELTATAGNGIYDGFGHQAIMNEMKQLSEVALSLTNTSDSLGRPHCLLDVAQLRGLLLKILVGTSLIMATGVLIPFKFRKLKCNYG